MQGPDAVIGRLLFILKRRGSPGTKLRRSESRDDTALSPSRSSGDGSHIDSFYKGLAAALIRPTARHRTSGAGPP